MLLKSCQCFAEGAVNWKGAGRLAAGRGQAYTQLHMPEDMEAVHQARHRLVFDEFFYHQVSALACSAPHVRRDSLARASP